MSAFGGILGGNDEVRNSRRWMTRKTANSQLIDSRMTQLQTLTSKSGSGAVNLAHTYPLRLLACYVPQFVSGRTVKEQLIHDQINFVRHVQRLDKSINEANWVQLDADGC
jgi:hypothetical protein